MTDGTLYVVATPIGNRDDLSPRARRVLGDVALVASEDTRRTGRLLAHFGIRAQQLALHEHNEEQASERIVAALGEGRDVALVSDAGTPLISDPGYRLLAKVHAAGLPVSPVPGPSALIAALSVAGLPTDRFCFEGFLPSRAAARRKRLAALARESRTLVLYEAVHRIRDLLADIGDTLGPDRRLFVGRELSKLHEQCALSTAGEILDRLGDGRIPVKGEFVIVVEGAGEAADAGAGIDSEALLAELLPRLPHREAVAVVSRVCGVRRNDVYRRMLEITGGAGRDAEPGDS